MPVSYLLTITLVSGSALAYEVLLLRLFSIIQWHHFAFMIISLALLGYGVSGVFLALTRRLVSQHFAMVISANLLLLALSMPLCFMLAQSLPFNPAELLWDPMQILYWLAVYLVLAIPFFFAANIIGLSFYQFRQAITTLYGADLLGAAMGSVGIIVLLFVFYAQQILLVLPGMILVAALLAISLNMGMSTRTQRCWQITIVGVAGLMLWLLPGELQLHVSPYKSQSQLLNAPGNRVVDSYSSPLGLINVIDTQQVPLRYAPGLSIRSESRVPEQKAVFIDNDAMSAITRFEGDKAELTFLAQTTSALPYQLQTINDVLVLGAGTGSDVLQAWLFDVGQIDAVEQNPQLIGLLKQDYKAFSGGVYDLPAVSVFQSEARAFVTSSNRHYQLIKLSLMEGSGRGGNLYSMSENYLFTVEGLQQYLRHLKPNGYLSLTRWTQFPPRDMPKLLATAVAAMQQWPLPQPSQSLIMIRSWQTATLLIKNGVVSSEEISRLKQFCQQNNFDLAYYPGISEDEVNLYHKLRQPYLYQAATALIEGDSEGFIKDYKFNIAPATDDRPYFSQFFKWRTLPEIMSLVDQGGLFLLESGYLLLLAVFAQALLAGGLLLLLPLWLWQHKQRRTRRKGLNKPMLLFFLALGLAFLFVEIGFIQKFVLILHHPVYAVTTVIASFLLAAGLGSVVSGCLHQFAPQTRMRVAVAGIALLSLLYVLAFAPLSAFLLQQSDGLRYLLAVMLILPMGFFMGIPFPTALAYLGWQDADMIPWAWGINGFASVLSPIMATLIAMQCGFRVLIVVAVVLYWLAAWLFTQVVSGQD